MPKVIPVETRLRIVQAVIDRGFTLEHTAQVFGVGIASVIRFVRLFRETGQVDHKPFPGRTSPFSEADLAKLDGLVSVHSDASSQRLADMLAAEGIVISDRSVRRHLGNLGYSLKKRPSSTTGDSTLTWSRNERSSKLK